MSNIIEHSEYLGDGRLHIRRGVAVGLLVVHEDDMAEVSWLDELDMTGALDGDPDENLLINEFWWEGQWSDTEFTTLTEKLLPETTGFAQLLFVHEDGDLVGLEVNDGVVTHKKVRVTLE